MYHRRHYTGLADSKLKNLFKGATNKAGSGVKSAVNNYVGNATSSITGGINNIGGQLDQVVDNAVKKVEAMTLPPVTIVLDADTRSTVIKAVSILGGSIAAAAVLSAAIRRSK